MDQQLINTIIGIASFAISWMIKIIWETIQKLRSDLHDVEQQLADSELFAAKTYVDAGRFERLIRELFQKIDSVSEKIDRKVTYVHEKVDKKADKD
jgi:putative heme degradation protein